MAELERKVTVFTEVELAQALIEAYEVVFKTKPTTRVIVNAWSQCALECGRDGKGNINTCRNYNLGNITITQAQAKEGRDYWTLRCKEQLRDKAGKLTGEWKWFDMRFAANSTLLDGAVHYWTFFAAAKRKVALDAMRNGGPKEFTDALAAIWYMTANPEHYLKGLNTLAPIAAKSVETAFANLAAPPAPEPPATPPAEPEDASTEPEGGQPPAQPPEPTPEPPTGSTGASPADTPEELFWPEPPVPDATPMLSPEADHDRESGMVPVVHLNQSAWDQFVLWFIALFTRFIHAFRKGSSTDGNVSSDGK